jgi:hypothetical protein
VVCNYPEQSLHRRVLESHTAFLPAEEGSDGPSFVLTNCRLFHYRSAVWIVGATGLDRYDLLVA